MSTIQDISQLIRFRKVLEFLSPNLNIGMGIFIVFLLFPPIYTELLWGAIEEEAGIEIAVFCLGGSIALPLAEFLYV